MPYPQGCYQCRVRGRRRLVAIKEGAVRGGITAQIALTGYVLQGIDTIRKSRDGPLRLSIIAALQPNRVPVARRLLRQIGGLLSITEGIDSFGAHRLQIELLALRGVGRGDYGRRGLAPCQVVPSRALCDHIGLLRVGLILSVCQIDVYRLLQILQGTFIVGHHGFSGGNGSIEGIVGSPREHEDAHAK